MTPLRFLSPRIRNIEKREGIKKCSTDDGRFFIIIYRLSLLFKPGHVSALLIWSILDFLFLCHHINQMNHSTNNETSETNDSNHDTTFVPRHFSLLR